MPQYRSRRGSFGLQPRVAPNVTNQIVALAREYVATRDRLIMDAWRSGGTFEGKKATDDMVLAYWKERQVGLDKDDPTYEQANNQIMQLEYAIAQSKADLRHLRGKLSDQEYAQFFLHWAKKVPKNSEFWRVLQKDAAQLIESAKAKARANSERLKTEAFSKFVGNQTSNHIAIGEAMTAALAALSTKTGLRISGNGAELLAMLTTNVKNFPDQYNILLDAIKKDDPGWDGNLTEGYFTTHINDALVGYENIADRAQKDGFVTAYRSASDGMANMSAWGQNTRVWPVSTTYSNVMNQLNKVLYDPNASQMDKLAASARAAEALSGLSATPGIDAGTKEMIDADSQRLLGKDAGDAPSYGPSVLGRVGVDEKVTAALSAWWTLKADMDANPGMYAYGPVDGAGNYDPTGTGALGIVPLAQVSPGAQAVMVPGLDGKAVLAMVTPHAVYMQDPNNPGSQVLVPKTYQFSYNVGGKTVQLWGYSDAQGVQRWSVEAPFAAGTTTSINGKGDVSVMAPPSATLAQQIASLNFALTPDEQVALLNGGKFTRESDSSAENTAGVKRVTTFSVNESGYLTTSTTDTQVAKDGSLGNYTTTPVTLAGPQSIFGTALAAGYMPGVTFDSPLQASAKAAGTVQAQEEVNRYTADPAFQYAFLTQTMLTLGTSDYNDPRIKLAWSALTTGDRVERVPNLRASERPELSYPGAPRRYEGKPMGITYGHTELVLPSLPGAESRDSFDRGGNGYNLPSAPSSTPTLPPVSYGPTATPTATPTVTSVPTVAPLAGPAPTVTPTSTPAPSATPYVNPDKLGY